MSTDSNNNNKPNNSEDTTKSVTDVPSIPPASSIEKFGIKKDKIEKRNKR